MSHVRQRRHLSLVKTTFHIPTFEDKGRLHVAITKSRLITAGEIPFKHARARLPSIGINRDSATIDLAYLFTGLVTITQFRLFHRIFQGVEHTDLTEWSNSHRSIGDKFVVVVQRILGSFQWLFTIFRHLVNCIVTAPQHSNKPKALSLSRNGS